ELVEAPGGRALLSQAESSAHEGGLDRADGRKLEHLESEIVGRACAGQKLPKDAMLGLVPAELGRVARKRRLPRGRKDRDAEQIRVDEEMLAGRDPLAHRRQVESIARAAEEAVRNPEPPRARAKDPVYEVPMVQLGRVNAVEDDRHRA